MNIDVMFNTTNVKYFLNELSDIDSNYKELLTNIHPYKKNKIIEYISKNCIIPNFKFRIDIKDKCIVYNDLILQINNAIINGLKNDPSFKNNIHQLKLNIANKYVTTFDDMYKNIINIKINKHRLFSKEKICIHINQYIHLEKFIFFCSSYGMIKIYGSKKDKFSYKLNLMFNIHGMNIPNIESLNAVIITI